jgi:predicted Ser/Thr protein kinase
MDQQTLRVGEEVSQTYRVVRRIGEGGMGEVYEVRHLRLSGRYALKVVSADGPKTADGFRRFQREAEVTSQLRHPNIVQVVDFSRLPDGAPYLVMEYLDGQELASVIAREGRFSPARVVSYAKQIAAGLAAAHEKGIVHRDLKPQNLFVLEVIGHTGELVKIVDFGISKVKDASTHLTRPAAIIGTVHYMSPEQARGLVDEIDGRTDQFALAAIVYELLLGKMAFPGEAMPSILYKVVNEEPFALRPEGTGSLPPAVADVLRRGLAKSKDARYPSVLDFADALEQAFLDGASTVPRIAAMLLDPPRVATTRPMDAVKAPTTLGSTAAESVQGRVAPRPKRWLVPAGAAAVAAAFGIVWSLRGVPPRDAPAGTTAAAAAPPAAAAPAAGHEPPPVVAPPAPSAAPAPEPPPAPAAAMTKAEESTDKDKKDRRTTVRKKVKPAPEGRARNHSSRCEPNYDVDADGEKHFKPECFK